MADMTAAPAPRRLFTALFPDADALAAIDAARRGWGGLPRRLRPVPERMHVTLQFFNAVDAEREQAWRAALAGLRFDPFDIALTRPGAGTRRAAPSPCCAPRPAPHWTRCTPPPANWRARRVWRPRCAPTSRI